MFVLGGSLKRRERLSARLGDILSMLYLGSAALKHFADNGRQAGDLPLLHWAMHDTLYRIQEAFYGLFENLPNRPAAFFLKHVVFPYGREFKPPSDKLGHQVVSTLLEPSAARDRLTAGVYIPKDENDPVGALEAALRAVIAAEPIGVKIRAARDAQVITGRFPDEIVDEALTKGVINKQEHAAMERARVLRRRAIMVDDFPRDLGKSEIFQSTQAVTFETLHKRA